MIFPTADLYIMGHDHRKGAVPTSTLEVVTGARGKLITKQKRQWLCRSGSFLRGYVENEPSYVAGALMRPTDLGTIRIEVKVTRETRGGTDLMAKDIHVWV